MARLQKNKVKWIKWQGLAMRVTFRALPMRIRDEMAELDAELKAWAAHKGKPSRNPPDLRPREELKEAMRRLSIDLCCRYVRRLDATEAGESAIEPEAQRVTDAGWDAIQAAKELGLPEAECEALEGLWVHYCKLAPVDDGTGDEDVEPLELDYGEDEEGEVKMAFWNDADASTRAAILEEWPDLILPLATFIADQEKATLLKKSRRPQSLARARTPG